MQSIILIANSVREPKRRTRMRIHANMNLGELKERMSNTEPVSDQDAEKMRDFLTEGYEDMDTADIPEDEWLHMLNNL